MSLQVHDIEFASSLDIIVTQTLPELSKYVAEGKAKHIGVTGYPVSVLKECIEKSNINIACVLSYSRLTLIDDTLLEYIPFFKVRKFVRVVTPNLMTDDFVNHWFVETRDRCN